MSTAEYMDIKDVELRQTIVKMWPVQAKKKLNLLVPPDSELVFKKMTVGKIYAGYLIVENWRAYKNSQGQGPRSKSANLLAKFFVAFKSNAHKSNLSLDSHHEREDERLSIDHSYGEDYDSNRRYSYLRRGSKPRGSRDVFVDTTPTQDYTFALQPDLATALGMPVPRKFGNRPRTPIIPLMISDIKEGQSPPETPCSIDPSLSMFKRQNTDVSPTPSQYTLNFASAVNSIVYKANKIVEKERREKFYGKSIYKLRDSEDSDDYSLALYNSMSPERTYNLKSVNNRNDKYFEEIPQINIANSQKHSQSKIITNSETEPKWLKTSCNYYESDRYYDQNNSNNNYYSTAILNERSKSPSLIDFSLKHSVIEQRVGNFQQIDQFDYNYTGVYYNQELPRVLPSPIVPKTVASEITTINFPQLNNSPTHSIITSKFHAIPPPSVEPPDDLFSIHSNYQDSPPRMSTMNTYVPPISPILYDLDETDDPALFEDISLRDPDNCNDFYRIPIKNVSFHSFKDLSTYSSNFSPFFFSPQPPSHDLGNIQRKQSYYITPQEPWSVPKRSHYSGLVDTISSQISVTPPVTTEHSIVFSKIEGSTSSNLTEKLPLLSLRRNNNQIRYTPERPRRNFRLNEEEDDEEWC